MKCFYQPTLNVIVDTISDETGLSSVCGETLEQVSLRHPGVEVWDWDDAFNQMSKIKYQKLISPPRLIDCDRFDEMLNILPPMKHQSSPGAESFMISECLDLDLHSIFCRIGDKYFEMVHKRSLTHLDIVESCLAVISESEGKS